MMKRNSFDTKLARQRCLKYRRRILDVSQKISALHAAPAFSALEITDCIYHGFMRTDNTGAFVDTFVMSKGHGCMAQYVVLEDLGIIPSHELDNFCTGTGSLGAHPDLGTPGVAASTGSLGHGLAMSVGMAYAGRILGQNPNVFVVLSDGELQEGSTWEAMMMAANLQLDNLFIFIDHNGFQSYGRTSETHPKFYPIVEKLTAFGFEVGEVNGHDEGALFEAVTSRAGGKPMAIVANTIKGRGVSYMENEPIWHYRSPSPAEYKQACDELREISS
jgi:transketolase